MRLRAWSNVRISVVAGWWFNGTCLEFLLDFVVGLACFRALGVGASQVSLSAALTKSPTIPEAAIPGSSKPPSHVNKTAIKRHVTVSTQQHSGHPWPVRNKVFTIVSVEG